MSFDLVVFHAAKRMTPSEANEQLRPLLEGALDPGDDSDELSAFLEQLSARFPGIDDPALAGKPDDADGCPWACSFERGPRHVALNIRWSFAEELAPIVVDLALDHELSCLDPQAGVVYQPPSLFTGSPSDGAL